MHNLVHGLHRSQSVVSECMVMAAAGGHHPGLQVAHSLGNFMVCDTTGVVGSNGCAFVAVHHCITSFGACVIWTLRFLLPARLSSRAVFSWSRSLLPEVVGANASGSVVLLGVGMTAAALMLADVFRVLSGVLLPPELIMQVP